MSCSHPRRAPIGALALLAALGCAESSSRTLDSASDSPRPHGLHVSAYVSIRDHPSVDESARTGLASVFEYGALGMEPRVSGARVTFDGIDAPEDAAVMGDYRTPLGATFPGAVPGGHVTLVVTHPTLGSVTLGIDCPADFTVTAPVEGAHVAIGVRVPVTWSGRVVYPGVSESAAQIAPWNVADDRILFFGGEASAYASIHADTDVIAVVPQVTVATGYVLDVAASGNAAVSNGIPSADCILTRRVHLVRD